MGQKVRQLTCSHCDVCNMLINHCCLTAVDNPKIIYFKVVNISIYSYCSFRQYRNPMKFSMCVRLRTFVLHPFVFITKAHILNKDSSSIIFYEIRPLVLALHKLKANCLPYLFEYKTLPNIRRSLTSEPN